jgi:molybdate transport repressor ModE-like protein
MSITSKAAVAPKLFTFLCSGDRLPDLARGAREVQNADGGIGKPDKLGMNRDLEVRHCRILVAVSDKGGIAAAARALGLSQSTVSETLSSLERVLDAPVVVRRRGREAALTAAAEALLPHARALIAASEAALVAASAKTPAVLRLGTVESISSFLLPKPLGRLRQRWPGVDIRITIGLCEDLRQRVRRFELDAALTIEAAGHAGGEGGGSRALSPAQLRLVASPRNSLAGRAVSRADLASCTFLLADSHGAFNGLMRSWFEGAGRSPKFESAGSIDGVKRGVQSSDAIGVLPAYAIAGELSAGTLIALALQESLPAIALLLTTPEPPLDSPPLHNLIAQIGDALQAI